MWLLRTNDSEAIRWLQPNHSYNFGRADDNDFILKSQAASRYQFSIVIGEISESEMYNTDYVTPISVVIKSRAKTIVNGKVFRLSKTDKEAIEHRITNELNNKIEAVKTNYDEKTQTKFVDSNIVISIDWKPLNITTFTGSLRFNDDDVPRNLLDELNELFQLGIDLRVTDNPLIATHYYTYYDQPNYSLKICLSRSIPILNYKWVNFIKQHKPEVSEWFINLNLKKFLPKSFNNLSNEYLIPNKRRQGLFGNVIIVSFNRGTEKLKKWIHCLNGEVMKLDILNYYNSEKLDEYKLANNIKKSKNNRNCLVMKFDDKESATENTQIKVNQLLSNFLKTFNSNLVNENELLESIKICSTDNLNFLNFSNGETRPRKRRKYERINKIEFLDFSSPGATQNQIEESEPENPKEVEINRLDNKSICENHSSKYQEEQHSTVAYNASKTEVMKKSIDSNILHKESTNVSVSEVSTINEPINDHKRISEFEDKIIIKKPKKISNFNPPMSLVDAIKSTKEKATQSVNNELGIIEESPSNNLNQELRNLTIVETVEIKLRTPRNQSITSNINEDYNGRKNFKNFKKNLKIESNVIRSCIDLKPVSINNEYNFIDSTETGNREKSYSETELKLVNDFKDVMNDVKGYQFPSPVGVNYDEDDNNNEDNIFSFKKSKNGNELNSNSKTPALFVSDDESQHYIHEKTDTVTSVANGYFHEDDDDDDDDDQPKFGFSRS